MRKNHTYLSPIVDCFYGLAVRWTLGTRPDAVLVNTLLDVAIKTAAGSEGRPVVYSDSGDHNCWSGWLFRMNDANLVWSMSRKGVRLTTPSVKDSLGS